MNYKTNKGEQSLGTVYAVGCVDSYILIRQAVSAVAGFIGFWLFVYVPVASHISSQMNSLVSAQNLFTTITGPSIRTPQHRHSGIHM